MSEPYIGEIRMFGSNFAPAGWSFCDGQQIPISQNDALFTLIGTTYGGDGQETFNLPDMQGRLPLHMGTGSDGVTYTIGEKAGVESVTLTTQQLPVHNHAFIATDALATDANPGGLIVAQTRNYDLYTEDTPNQPMAANMLAPVGGSQPHDNMQPFLVISFIISLYGLFPSPS